MAPSSDITCAPYMRSASITFNGTPEWTIGYSESSVTISSRTYTFDCRESNESYRLRMATLHKEASRAGEDWSDRLWVGKAKKPAYRAVIRATARSRC